MYQTYITEALVCGSIDNSIADRSFLLFTREAGMVYALAKSVREERSKHRYSLQDFSHARVTLVRGKSGWKVTGTEPLHNFYTSAHSRDARAFLRNIFMLLKRVLHGETAHHTIFDDVVKACLLGDVGSLEKLETILSLRILHTLGYIAPEERVDAYIQGSVTSSMVNSMKDIDVTHHKTLITHALLESQL